MDYWSLEIDLVTRRLHEDPRVAEEPGDSPEIILEIRRPLRPYGNPETTYEPGGSSLDPEIFDWNPEAIGEPGGSSLDFIHRTRNQVGNLGFPLEIGGLHKGPGFLGNPKYLVFSQGLYSVFLGKTTTGTCLDFTFCCSEAGHYRVPMMYSTSAGSH
ncbi:hypothetical protein F2Q70_00016939 [Brassica cretica]|uniref:Uncharacterized protein n=1 Tax=Brassica cretica TaxID=69181 RepID=A0A8S9I058_BRACR|nr:hypothetical protein F2Q70_00016939 [Brassica cretica]